MSEYETAKAEAHALRVEADRLWERGDKDESALLHDKATRLVKWAEGFQSTGVKPKLSPEERSYLRTWALSLRDHGNFWTGVPSMNAPDYFAKAELLEKLLLMTEV